MGGNFQGGRFSLKMGEARFQYTLNISVANICRILVCIVTNLSCSNSFSKDDDLSPDNRRKHLSCRQLILSFTIRNKVQNNVATDEGPCPKLALREGGRKGSIES